MNELLLHYVWRYGLFAQKSLFTIDGDSINIYSPGTYSSDTGPDFKNARIGIGTTIWVGHVEIHINSSDWYLHKHQIDPAYDLVILHVVYNHDKEVFTDYGAKIPVFVLELDLKVRNNYEGIMKVIHPIPCGEKWRQCSSMSIEHAIVNHGVERIEELSARFERYLAEAKGGWVDLFQRVIFRTFGFGKHHENLDELSQSLSSKIIYKHSANLFQIEGLLFGQAGLIPAVPIDVYSRALTSEYAYLATKYFLEIRTGIHWTSKRTRPKNSASLRLAQLASFITEVRDLFDFVLDCKSEKELLSLDFFVSSYWRKHYDFGRKSSVPIELLGNESKQLLFLNGALPLRMFYARQHGNPEAYQEWVEILDKLKPETNRIVSIWKNLGYDIPNAFYSQAFLYTYKKYCIPRNCLACRIGQVILQR